MTILCATGLATAIVSKRKDFFKRLFVTYAISGILAVCFYGFNPYMVNIIRHGNIGWPIAGESHAVDIISQQISPQFAAHNRLYKFIVGYNSYCSNSQKEYPKVKFPGQTNVSELKTYGGDTRIGGFGPLFGLILLMAVTMLTILLAKKELSKRQIILLGGLLCSVFVNPECWWARYVPQLWLFCILAFIYAIKSFDIKTRRNACLCLAVLLTANYGVSAIEQTRAYITWSACQRGFNKKLLEAQKQSKAPAYVNFGVFYSKTASILEHNGIAYTYFNPNKDTLPQGYRLYFKDAETVIYIKQQNRLPQMKSK